jgi:hypothetical protein
VFNDIIDYDKIKMIQQENISEEERGIKEYLRLEYRWLRDTK